MSIGRTKEEQELTALLSRTLVQKQVIEPMEKIGWSHASPPPPDYTSGQGGQPAQTEGAPTPVQSPASQPAGGQPAAQSGIVPPAAAQVKADTPEATDIVATMETLRDPATGLIMGKYKTVTEALKGAGHLANMAKQAFQERDAALQKLGTLTTENVQARPQPVASPATAPVPAPQSLLASRAKLEAAQAKLDGVLSGLDNDAIVDAETLKQHSVAQREVAELAADVRVQEMQHAREAAQRAEQSRWDAVDEYMLTNHPDALNHSAEIGLHISSDPVLQEAVSALVAQGKEVKASILAWQSYERAVLDGTAAKTLESAKAKEEDLLAREQVRKELVDKARKDAGVIHSSAGGSGIHESPEAAAPSRDEVNALVARMRNEGDSLGMPAATRFRELVIGRHLDPSMFGPR